MTGDTALTKQDIKTLIPVRDSRGNKGTFGRILVIAGSKCMAGAAYLCGLGSLRTGAGLVKIMTPEDNRVIIQTLIPEALLLAYQPDEINASFVSKEMKWADVIAIGPGLGTSDTAAGLVKAVFKEAADSGIPLVIDADALNITAEYALVVPFGACITPHIGEMSRLTGTAPDAIKDNRAAIAVDYAVKHNVTVVLKDHETCIASYDGRYAMNNSGSSALAKGGSGDVLTGVIAALISQGMNSYNAARLGAFLHGTAGIKCAEALSEYGVLAHEIADMVPVVIRENLR